MRNFKGGGVVDVECKQNFYDRCKQGKDEKNNQELKKYSKYIDKIIDILLDEFSVRGSNNNATVRYDVGNEISVEIKYETTVFGSHPRYEINILQNNTPEYCSNILFRYYHGGICQFISAFNPVNTFVTELDADKLDVFINAVLYRVINSELSDRIIKKLNKYLAKIKYA